MAAQIDRKIDSCLTEMEKLKEDMIKLKEKKKSCDLENKKKVQEIEPNMAVMKNWLDTSNRNKEAILLAEDVENKYQEVFGRGKCEHTIEEQQTIRKKYDKYVDTHSIFDPYIYTQASEVFNTAPSLNNTSESVNHAINVLLEPSEFMKNYIEATYNLFQIQQKRIDELEAKLNI